MNIKRSAALVAAILLICCASASAGLKDAVPAFKSGNWTVLRSIDAMTDAVDCTGIYKANYGIQLVKDELYIRVLGGIEGVILRFGEKPARPLRLPTDMEKKIDSIEISGSDFSELLDSDRLRVEVSTLVSGVVDEDLDLKGIKSALENIQAKCPAQQEVARPVVESKPPTESSPVCTEETKSRMRAQGIKGKQIQAICKL